CVVGSLLLVDWRRQQAAEPLRFVAAAPAQRQGFARQALGILALPWPRTILIVGVVEGAAGFGVLAIWASHLHGQMGFSLSAAGGIVALFGGGGVVYMASARRLIGRLGQARLAAMGGCIVLMASLVVAFPPYRWLSIPASLVMGFGFFGFHNVMQANAAQMAPASRGTGVSLFAASLFGGQSLGVLLAANLVERIGSGWVIAAGGVVLALLTQLFSWALRGRERQVLQSHALKK
ncbi:MAG: MFS transporter, partial [Burkholderiaceae bacterium]